MFGASGQIGRFLLPRLRDGGQRVLALGRNPAPAWASKFPVEWLRGDLFAPDCPTPGARTLISLGPLDGLVAWLARAPSAGIARLVAFSSTSVMTKRDSADPSERALASRLLDSETRLVELCTERGIAWTLFRPTLIYGAGMDRSLSAIARLARRYRVLPMPFPAAGLRAPVHADDLAAACLLALPLSATHGQMYALAGGETLRYDQMLGRLRGSLGCRVLRLPVPIAALRAALAVGRIFRGKPNSALAALERVNLDLTFDITPAQRDFSYAPRSFHPVAAMWSAAE